MRRIKMSLFGIALILVSCAPGSGNKPAAPELQATTTAQTGRTLVMAVRIEPNSLAARPLAPQAIASYLSKRMFNADLALLDGTGVPRPYLAEALPELNTDSWRVFPDGRMETTYRLKAGVTWHDGSPLTSSDFVFAWHVYTSPIAGGASPPLSYMDEVAAPDPRTVLIRWKRPYADAGAIQSTGTGANAFPPLPQAILGDAFESGPEAMANAPFWNQAYVGLGPYRISQWEPGAFYVATAFDKHVLGAPKIERIKVMFMPDGNAVLAGMLAGDVQFSADLALQVSQVPLLLKEWPAGRGTAIQHPNQWRPIFVQLRPDYVSPRALLDPRVRKALAHAIDKQAIVDTVYEGQAPPSDAPIPPTSDVGREIDSVIAKYPLDLRQSADLMTQAGFTRGSDGVYTSPTGGRLETEIKSNAGVNFEAEMSILANGWGQAGFKVAEIAIPTNLAQDPEVRGAYPGLFAANTNVGEVTATIFTTEQIPLPENRWTGSNRSGFSNADYDRLVDTYTTTLDRTERNRLLVEVSKIFAEELPAISLSFQPQPWVFVSEVTGPALVVAESNVSWNIYEWELH